MSPVPCLAVLLAVCAITSSAPAPIRYVTYNQTQHGNHNVQADLENILILVVPSRKFIGSALNILDRRDIPSQKNIPEPPEIATEIIKEENLPEPPEPAKVEEKPQVIATKEEVKPVIASASPAGKDQPQDKKPVVKPETDKPAPTPSSRAGRGSVITAKLLGFGVSPATE